MNNSEHIQRLLQKHWNFSSFRPKQEAIIHEVLQHKDCLALLPTGGGKSLCYQIPALALDGVCLVISPLIALMKDQVAQLKKRNIKAIALAGGLNSRELDIALDNCIYGDVKLLYLSPERLQSEIVQERLKKMKVSFIAVDEAHCISQWGYDFRPAYIQIAQLRELLPETSILALTATAPKEVVKDIQDKLSFTKHNVIQNSFLRENLAYMVLEENHKMNRVLSMLKKTNGSAIIYVRSRKRSFDVAQELNSHGITALHYHAGLSSEERNSNQEKWMKDQIKVMVATNAFGMGIDKANVRLVIHLQTPNSIEAYFQEAGRAGRDGKKAYAVILYRKSELEASLDRFTENYPSATDVKKLYQHIADYYQIAIGDGLDLSIDFDLEQFCKNYKLNPSKTQKALHILEKDGFIKHDNYTHKPSTVKICCSSSQAINYQTPNTKKAELLQLILRLYPGIFDESIEIKERSLAIKLNQSSDYVHKLLKQLSQEQIIEYLPRTNSGNITFSTARHNSKQLPVANIHFTDRKQLLLSKLKSIHDYTNNTNYCRSSILLDYFGEKAAKNCGICDVCISQQTNSSEFKSKIKTELLQTLSNNPIDISIFVARYSKLKEQVIIDVIQELLAENILIKEGKNLRLNE